MGGNQSVPRVTAQDRAILEYVFELRASVTFMTFKVTLQLEASAR